MEDGESDPIDLRHTRRRLWVIVLLTLLAGAFPFVYCGQLSRAIRWQFGLWFFGVMTVAAMLYTPFTKPALGVLAVDCIAIYLAIILLAWKTEQVLPWKPYQKWWGYLLLFVAFQSVAYCLSMGVKDHWVEAFSIPTNSMSDTVFSGDRIFVEKLIFRVDESKRQSLVVFRAPEDLRHHSRVNYGRRLIAVGGDRLAIKSDQVFVNGQPLEEPYAKHEGELDFRFRDKLQQFPEQVIPAGQAFVLGDNRWASLDSRFFGFIPYADFIGEAKCVFWSQEYEIIYPTREFPQEREVFGKIRWRRMGQQLH
jgi:signal peptidase I